MTRQKQLKFGNLECNVQTNLPFLLDVDAYSKLEFTKSDIRKTLTKFRPNALWVFLLQFGGIISASAISFNAKKHNKLRDEYYIFGYKSIICQKLIDDIVRVLKLDDGGVDKIQETNTTAGLESWPARSPSTPTARSVRTFAPPRACP